MKRRCKWVVVVMAAILAAGCASSTKNTSSVKAAASQENVRNQVRSRAKAHTDLGFEYYALKQYGTALDEATVALKDDTSYTPTYNLLALIYMALGEKKSAEENFQRALQLSPADPEISNNYGWFLCQEKREQQAFPYFSTALQNPLYATPLVALNNAAACALQIRDYAAAEGYLTRALTRNPREVRALLAMANLKYAQSHFAEARYYVGEAHKYSEATPASIWLGLRVARKLGTRDDEARYQSLLKKQFPDSAETRLMSQGAFE